MEFTNPQDVKKPLSVKDVAAANGKEITIHGGIHIIRDMGEFSFVVLRLPDGMCQCTVQSGCDFGGESLVEEACVEVTGTVREEKRAPGGYEIVVSSGKVLSKPAAPMPISINKHKITAALENEIPLRNITLRNGNYRTRFRIQSEIVRGFRDYLDGQGFVEIHTPKINAKAAEGGANVFKMEYFGKKAVLAQSPQFYKQAMVGVYERVYEVAPVFRAEKHNTARHLNEYISMDFEMGYIDSFYDVMAVETGMLKLVMDRIREKYPREIALMKLDIPVIESIPNVRFKDAKELIAAEYGREIKDPYDLDPDEEQLIGKYFKEKYNSDFVFVTHYPAKKRPFYAMDDPEDPNYTLSFDLLFRGLEVTTGGQRIHDYDEQVAKIIKKKMNPDDFATYLNIHKHGMPPHGGLGIGLERLTMRLFNDDNIRYSSMFPRDMLRLVP